jgi:GT2 family glycosyltransferase
MDITDYEAAEFIPVTANGHFLAAELYGAARESSSDIYCFVEAGVSAVDADWLRELAGYALQESIGAVGGKLLTRDGTVTGTGLVIGPGGSVSRAHTGRDEDDAGNVFRNVVAGNYSAVSASLLATAKSDYEEVGGFDHEAFPSSLFDVDYCLRLWKSGKRVAFTPYSRMTTIAARPPVSPTSSELAAFRGRWPETVAGDPFVNPHLSRRDGRFRIDA